MSTSQNTLRHVWYEIKGLLLRPEFDETNPALREAVELAQMVHGRALVEFFKTAKRKYPNDIISNDFNFPPDKNLYSSTEMEQFNQKLFHLSSNRTNWHDEWDIRLLDKVKDKSREFIEHILAGKFATTSGEFQDWQNLKALIQKGSPMPRQSSNIAINANAQPFPLSIRIKP